MDLSQTVMNGTHVMTPWFARMGDNAIFTYQDYAGAAGITVDIIHKNLQDTGPGEHYDPTGPVTWNDLGAADNELHSFVATDLKELVRFEILASGPGPARLVRFLEPVWFDSAEV